MSSRATSGYAVLQSVCLVLAIVGGTVGLAGPVAAAAQNLAVTNEDQKLQPNGNLTFEVTDDVSVEEHPIHVWIDSESNDEFDPGERNKTFNSSRGNTINGSFRNVDLSAGQYELMAVERATLTVGQQPQSRTNFTIDDTPPAIVAAVAFTETNGTQAYGSVGETVVEVVFNDSLSNGSGGTAPEQGDIRIKLENGDIIGDVTVNASGPGDAGGDRRLVLSLDGGLVPTDVKSVGTAKNAQFTDGAGNTVRFHAHPVRSASTTVAEAGENTTAFQGEEVAIVGDEDDEGVFMRSSDGNTIFDKRTGRDSKVHVWSSDGWSTAQRYRIFFDDRTNPNFLFAEDVGLGLRNLDLSVTPTQFQFSTQSDVTASVSANASNRTVGATLLDSSGTTVTSRTASLDGTTVTVNFGQQSAGDYHVEVEDAVTGLTATSRVFQVRSPEPTPTPTGTPVPSPTATIVFSPTPSETTTATRAGGVTPVRTPYPIETFSPTPLPTPTATALPTDQTPTEPAPTPTPEAPEGVGGILQAVVEGANAAVKAIIDALSGILP